MQLPATIQTLLLALVLKAVGAVIIWIVGRWLIGLAMRLVTRLMMKRAIDPTLQRYALSVVQVGLLFALVIFVLSFLGIELTALAALLAGIGLAVGAAWGGLLTNFAAGVFLVMLRPFQVGDYVSAGGVTGSVLEIGLFNTMILTDDNIESIVGNNKIFPDTIQNFSAKPYRRVQRTAQVGAGANTVDARAAHH